jgi:hypothetical protein
MNDWLLGVLLWGAPLVYVLFVGFRPPDPRSLGRWTRVYGITLTHENRPIIARYLRRTRRIRTVGTLAGLAASLLYVTLTGGGESNSILGSGLFLAVVGYLLGTIVGEAVVPRPSRGDIRTASLVPRILHDYLPGYAVAGLRVVPVLSVALVPIFLIIDEPTSNVSGLGFTVTSVSVLLMASGVQLMQRLIVNRPRPALSPELLDVDDAIRSASVHALAGGGLALSLVWLTYQLGAIGGAMDSPVLRWFVPALGVLTIGLALWSWIDLAHPKQWRVRHYVQRSHA